MACAGFAVLWVILHNASDQLPWHLPASCVLLRDTGAPGLDRCPAVLRPVRIPDHRWPAGLAALATLLLQFLRRRALRILPLYYTVLLGLLIATPFAYPGTQMHGALVNQLWLWTFTGNWTSLGLTGFTHFWSLAVEEQFYLVWPLVVLRLSPRALVHAYLGISVQRSSSGAHSCSTAPPRTRCTTAPICVPDGCAGARRGRCCTDADRELAGGHAGAPAVISLAVLAAVAVTALVTNGFDFESDCVSTFGYGVLALGCATLVTVVRMASPASEMRRSNDPDVLAAATILWQVQLRDVRGALPDSQAARRPGT